ncbi:hypothetical protein GGI07_004557 [Coemansia sp. Benny D115]|nr:hypothetical protein GGI07_004557 [Coemansia sp. Benny D115]
MDSRERYTDTLSYAATCLSMLCGGTTSLFATYGSSFSDVLGFSQYETNLVASLGDYAHYMSAPLFGYLSTRTGPTRVIQAAGVLMFLGYMGLSYALDGSASASTHAQNYVGIMSVLFALVGVGSKAAYMSSMATAASNFRHSRHSGIALGIPLSLYGLSTFVFSSVKARWFESDKTPARYLAFMAVVSAAAHLGASRFVVLKSDPAAAAVATGSVAVARKRGASVTPRTAGAGSDADDTASASVSPSSEHIEMAETRRRRMTVSAAAAHDVPAHRKSVDVADPPDRSPTTAAASTGLGAGAAVPVPAAPLPAAPLPAAPSAIRAFCRDPVAWSLLLGLICFSGPGLAFVNNCGTMVRALAHNSALTDEQVGRYKDHIVATQSFFSFASRLATGYFSDLWRTRLRLPRAMLLVAAALLMVHAQTAASRAARLEDLPALAVLIGSAMGAVFTLAPTITAEAWGAENFGVCWGIITLGPAIGGHVCNLIFGSNWDAGLHDIATRLGPSAPRASVVCDSGCFAPAFVSTTHIAWVSVFFFALVVGLPRAAAVWRLRK